jgi:ABC-2 type transport system permease protein
MTLLVSLVAMIPVIEVGLLIDIYHPKLVWENEQQAFKQNLNVVLSMLTAIVLGGAIIYAVVKFIESPQAAASFMLVSFGVLGLIFYFVLMSWGIAHYEELDG